MKNERTPRTLSECDFTTGYPSVPRARELFADGVYAIIVVVCAAAIGAMLAWGF